MSINQADAVVVGGGLAGLTAGALLADAGKRVVIVERSHALGGRGATTVVEGFHLNFGPHAWYLGGPGTAVLGRLGVHPRGNPPKPSANFAILNGRIHTMPLGFISLLTTDLLGLQGKLEAARILASMRTLDPGVFDHQPVEEWLQGISDPRARQLVEMLIRISSYADALEVLSAGAALGSLQMVIRQGVLYVDGGWQTIVNALRDRAVATGATIRTSTPVREVLHDARGVEGVRLEDGGVIRAPNVILAVDPGTAGRLTSGFDTPVRAHLMPSRVACLDVALARYPNRSVIAAFGADRPLYFSVHSASAALAPGDGAVVHAAKYLHPLHETDPAEDERELETMMDMLQPGWRGEVKMRRFLPRMTVTHAIPTADGGGLAGRPSVCSRSVAGLYVAGDWVGRDGTLGNAAVASAAHAVRHVLDKSEGHCDSGAAA